MFTFGANKGSVMGQTFPSMLHFVILNMMLPACLMNTFLCLEFPAGYTSILGLRRDHGPSTYV